MGAAVPPSGSASVTEPVQDADDLTLTLQDLLCPSGKNLVILVHLRNASLISVPFVESPFSTQA